MHKLKALYQTLMIQTVRKINILTTEQIPVKIASKTVQIVRTKDQPVINVKNKDNVVLDIFKMKMRSVGHVMMRIASYVLQKKTVQNVMKVIIRTTVHATLLMIMIEIVKLVNIKIILAYVNGVQIIVFIALEIILVINVKQGMCG